MSYEIKVKDVHTNALLAFRDDVASANVAASIAFTPSVMRENPEKHKTIATGGDVHTISP